jgi:DNA-binding FadR family transcriptional regulator
MGASLDHAEATSQVSIAEIWDVRRTLEVRTAMLAAENRSDAEATEIMGYAEAMAEAGDDMAKVTAADVAFHQAIARASHNALFLQIVRSFASMMHFAVPAAWRTRTTDNQRTTVLARHRALAQAIMDRDSGAAAAAMSGHFDRSIDQLLRQDTAE